jgi:hypothetical protein
VFLSTSPVLSSKDEMSWQNTDHCFTYTDCREISINIISINECEATSYQRGFRVLIILVGNFIRHQKSSSTYFLWARGHQRVKFLEIVPVRSNKFLTKSDSSLIYLRQIIIFIKNIEKDLTHISRHLSTYLLLTYTYLAMECTNLKTLGVFLTFLIVVLHWNS